MNCKQILLANKCMLPTKLGDSNLTLNVVALPLLLGYSIINDHLQMYV